MVLASTVVMSKRHSEASETRLALVCRACSSLPFPVHRAAAYGHIDCLKDLLGQDKRKKGSDLFLDLDGQTPLHTAAEAGQLVSLKYLIENTKISPYHRNSNGETCAHAATGGSSLECIQYLLGLPACKGGRHPLALEKDYMGNTVLHLAVAIGNNDIAIWLLQTYGQAIANLANGAGQLPLHTAAAKGNLEFIRTATKYDLQMVNRRDINGATPAFYAARGGDLQCLKYLVEKTRADVNAVTSRGHSLLHVASLWGHGAVVQWLLTVMKKSAISQTSNDNATAFHYAAFGGQTAILKILQKAANGKKKYITASMDRQGNTPLHLAAMNDHVEGIQYLLEQGASPKSKNKGGQTPGDLATRRGNHRAAWLITNYKKGSKLPLLFQQPPAHVVPASVSSTSGYGSYASPITPPFSHYGTNPNLRSAPRAIQQSPATITYAQRSQSEQPSWGNWFGRKKSRQSTAPIFFNMAAERESITERVDIGGPSRILADKQVQTEADPFGQNVIFVGNDQLIENPFATRAVEYEAEQAVSEILRYDHGNNLNENLDVSREQRDRQANYGSLDRSSLRSLSISTDAELRDLVDDEECIAATEHIDRVLEETSIHELREWNSECLKTSIKFPGHRRRSDSPRPSDLGPPMSPPIFYDPNAKPREVHSQIYAF